MKYELRFSTGTQWITVQLTADDFATIRTAQSNATKMLAIEEKFDGLLQNYEEYERELLSIGLRYSLFQVMEWSTGIGDLLTINRRLANVLTMARGYIEHTKQDLNNIYGRPNEIEESVNQAFSASYDRSLGYRVMETVRNYMQHTAFAVAGISYDMGWQGEVTCPQTKLRTRIIANLDIKGFHANGGLKRSVLRELDLLPDRGLNVTTFLRDYIDQISQVHGTLRSLCLQVEDWERTIKEVLGRCRGIAGQDVYHINGIVENELGQSVENLTVFEEPLKRLAYLRRKNLPLTNLAKRCVSNEAE